MLIQEPFQPIANEPEIYDRKMMMLPPAAESLHSGGTPEDSPIYPPIKRSRQYTIAQAGGDFPTQHCLSSSSDFVPACFGSISGNQPSYSSPNKLHGIAKTEKNLHKRHPSNSYQPSYHNSAPQSSSFQRFNQAETVDSVPRNCKLTTRESTTTLKNWLQEHKSSPYPTKGEKIMLAIVTKMTLTQVSTWFANARRRLKKENKMTWHPKNRSSELQSQSQEKNNLEEDESSNQAVHMENGSSDIDDQQVPKSQFNLELIGQNSSMFPEYRNSASKPEILLDSNAYLTSSFDNYGNSYQAKATALYQQPTHIDLYPSRHQGSSVGDSGNNISFDASVGMRDSHCSRSVPIDNSQFNWSTNVNSYRTSNVDNEMPTTMRHYHNVVNDRGCIANSCAAYQADYHHQSTSEQLKPYKQFNSTFENSTEEQLLQMSTPKYFQPNNVNFQSAEYNAQPDQIFNHQPTTTISSPLQLELESNRQLHVSNFSGDNGLSMNDLLQTNLVSSSNVSLSPSDSSSPILQYSLSATNVATSTETSSVSYASSCKESYSPLPQHFSPSYNSNFNSDFARNSTAIGQSITNEQSVLMKLPPFGDSDAQKNFQHLPSQVQ